MKILKYIVIAIATIILLTKLNNWLYKDKEE